MVKKQQGTRVAASDANPVPQKYDFKSSEARWKKHWYDNNIYKAVDFSEKPKQYILVEFTYPSGKSMHVGHMMRFTMPEMYSRYLRMNGYNVMFPTGWDAFGLPAENFAIKTGTPPQEKVAELADQYRTAMQDVGYGIDWDREFGTTDPDYYKWTQWIFLKLYEAGLAEMREEPVWWSDKMKTVLAEEEVEKDDEGNLVAERDGSPVRRRMLKQWVLKITEYADRLIEGLDTVDFPESVVKAQRNWIGRKEGINIHYPVNGQDEEIVCFTTRPDTNFGATFVVLSPEHPFVEKILNKEIEVDEKAYGAIEEYVRKAKNKTELERMSEGREKSGVDTTFTVKNGLNGKDLPLWISDFVLAHFGTGAVVGVPAHDLRDFQFATKYGLDIIRVVEGADGDVSEVTKEEQVQEEQGVMVNSEFLDGMDIHDATQAMMDHMEKEDMGKRVVSYSLRDWLFSRQRYWGEPIPLIHKEDGTVEAVVHTEMEDELHQKLPVELPAVEDYRPSDDGSSPLERAKDWVSTSDSDGIPAKRETNTMPNWAGSSWYYIRFVDPKNEKEFAAQDKMKYWLPVDKYFGGSEHTTLHLLYSRFWHQFLYDQGEVPTPEPYQWRLNGGILLGPDGTKMSKSKGNVIEPQAVLEKQGADVLRMAVIFWGPYDGVFPYNEASFDACSRTLRQIHELSERVGEDVDSDEVEQQNRAVHSSLKKMTRMFEDMKLNTAVSEIMIVTKKMREFDSIDQEVWQTFVKMIAPIVPFLAEELWQKQLDYPEWKDENSVHLQDWPEVDEEAIVEDTVEIPVQVNGKVRGTITIDKEADEEAVRELALADENVAKYATEDTIKKFIYVPGKIVTVVV